MQGKGLISTIGILLLLVCLWQLSFTFLSSRFESKATEYAIEKTGLTDADPTVDPLIRSARREYIDSIGDQEVINLGFTEMSYPSVKSNSLNLGLDLQGGMSMVLQVAVDEAIKSMTNSNPDPAIKSAILNAKNVEVAGSQDDFVTIFIDEYKKLKPNASLASLFATSPEYSGRININTTDTEVENIIRTETQAAINTTFEIIRARIDKLGVTQPNISLQEGRGRILVELPGVDDPERMRRIVQAEANLEFWETFSMDNALVQYLSQANEALRSEETLKRLEAKANDNSSNNTVDAAIDAVENAVDEAGNLLNGDSTNLTNNDDDDGLNLNGNANTDSLDADEQLAEFKADNPLFGLLQLNTQAQQNSPIIGFVNVNNKKELEEMLARPEVKNALPNDMRLWLTKETFEGTDASDNFHYVLALKSRFGTNNQPYLDGGVITDASSSTRQDGKVVVNMSMNAEGSRKWAEMTGQNVGKSVAVTLDNNVVTFPTVNGKITGGGTEISGNFSIEEAQDLANNLKIGKLPAPARIVEEATVGPSLGRKSIKNGTWSLIGGLLAVLGFMIYYYNKGGIVSVAALLLNMLFIIGILASLGTTLTLPGIAGIVLTIGMAVDANVIIYERIREELSEGSSTKKAIAEGFKKSYSAIIDANLTTLITAIILARFGIGPIRGFAIVLIIGIFSSLFTAVLLTRLFIDWYMNRGGKMKFNSGLELFKNAAYNFTKRRRVNYLVSLVVIMIGLFSMFTQGFEQGVDFKGGRTYTIDFDQNIDTEQLAAVLSDKYGEVPLVTAFGDDYRVTTSYRIGDTDPEMDNMVEDMLYDGAKDFFVATPSLEQFKQASIVQRNKVGPSIANDILRGAFLATALALMGIFLYILVRFRKWQFSLAAVITVIHDTLILLSIFSIFHKFVPFSLEINQAFIAALLTVIGYSINDTVVVFDRIREYLQLNRKKESIGVINDAINSTLSRTVITSLTTFFVIFLLFCFGGANIRGFAFALLIGVLVGTYSSIFIATPLVIDLSGQDVKLDEQKKPLRTNQRTRQKAMS